MAVKATVIGELAEIALCNGNQSVRFDVAVKLQAGMANITGFCQDKDVFKDFKAGQIVCMEGPASLREFNDEVSLQVSKAVVSHLKDQV